MAGNYYSTQAVYQRLSDSLAEDLQRDADRMTGALFGDQAPGSKNVSEEDLVNITKKGWTSSPFRQKLLDAIGPERFLYVAEKAGFYKPETPDSVRGNPDGPTFPDPTTTPSGAEAPVSPSTDAAAKAGVPDGVAGEP